jgi:hypothetical protein
MKFRVLVFLCVLLASSLCFGDMSIYLKGGGEHRVRKIVFKGQQADLFLPDGRVLTLPVSDIDLAASGIGSPVGTYGETKLGGGRKKITTNAPSLVNEAARQEALKHEWESSEKSAVALTDIGRFHEGEVVRIIDRKLTDEPVPMDYYWNSTPMNSQVQDQAYVVIYKNVDGTYGKKMIDAATFTTKFKIQTTATLEPPKVMTSPSVLSSTPEVQSQPQQTTSESAPKQGQPSLEHALTTPISTPPVPRTSNAGMIALVCLIAVASVAAIFVALKKRKKPFVDSSKFRTYEAEMKDFEMEIWLKNGKTLDQLIDICVKKFYQDNPAALSVAMKMMKGMPKSTVLPYLIKQSEKTQAEAEVIYGEMERRLDWIRQMIQSVSHKIGITPQSGTPKEAAAATPVPPPLPLRPTPAAPPASSPSPQTAPTPAAQAPAPPAQPQPAQSWETWGVVVDLEKEEAAAAASNLPDYLKSLHDQLGTLGK